MGILLDSLPGFTWWGGVGVTAIIGIISFLGKSALNAEIEKREAIEEDIKTLTRELKEMRENLHKVNLEIVNKINEVGIKIAEFRREISK